MGVFWGVRVKNFTSSFAHVRTPCLRALTPRAYMEIVKLYGIHLYGITNILIISPNSCPGVSATTATTINYQHRPKWFAWASWLTLKQLGMFIYLFIFIYLLFIVYVFIYLFFKMWFYLSIIVTFRTVKLVPFNEYFFSAMGTTFDGKGLLHGKLVL